MPMGRITAYVAGSVTLATGVITYAALERPNFYSAAVYLSQSNACLMILCNMALVVAGSFMYGLQQLLFGPLRPLETEQLWERGWFAMMEWVFAMSTFRDEFGVWFLVMFLSLFTGKIWGWIAEGRVDQLEQQAPNDQRLFHGRLVISLGIYVLFAFQMFWYSFDIVLYEARPGMTIMFVFEFAILCITALTTCLRYAIWVQEYRIIKQQVAQEVETRKADIRKARREAEERQRSDADGAAGPSLDSLPKEEDVDENEIEAPGWEAKRGWLFALDITSDLLKLLAYMAFFTILTVFYGIPIYIIRDLYTTVRSFTKRVSAYLKFQAATRDMDTRYPNATAEELAADNTCIVCREEMRPVDPQGAVPPQGQAMHQRHKPKKLPCGHILHFGCLSSWLERQQACPICRRSVFAAAMPPRGQPPPPAEQAAAAGANPQNGNNQPRQNRNEGRVYRLGPLRFQWGGRPGGRPDDQELMNMIARLAQNRARERLANGGVQDPARPTIEAQDLTTQPGPVVVDAADATNTPIHPGIRSAAARMALNAIEGQIQREMQALNVQGHRAATIRQLLNELDRARGIPQPPQQQLPPPTIAPVLSSNLPRHIVQPGGTGALPPGWTVASLPPQYRADLVNPNQPTIPVGRVPVNATNTGRTANFALPPGWSLVPLNPVVPGPAGPPTPGTAPSSVNPQPIPTPTVGTASISHSNPLAQILALGANNGAGAATEAGPSTNPTTLSPSHTAVNGTADLPTRTPASAAGPLSQPNPASGSPVQPQPTQPPIAAPSWSFPSPSPTEVEVHGEQSGDARKLSNSESEPATSAAVQNGKTALKASVEDTEEEEEY